MSRETDTSSSGPNGHGGAAYPSGTPPYGTPTASDSGAEPARSAAGTRSEGPKTETTLTTRVRINIPGSRPIPPVVVRKPVAEAEAAKDETGTESETTGTVAMPVLTDTAPPSPEPSAPAEEKANDWFAPRKPGAPKGGSGGGSTNGAGFPAGSGASGASGPSGTQGGPGAGSPGAAGGSGGGPRPLGANGAGPLGGGGGSRPGGTNGAGLPGATGAGPVAPGHGGGTGSFDVSAALASGPLGDPGRRDDLPYFSDDGSNGTHGANGRSGGRGPAGPSGPTSGPVTGDSPLASLTGPAQGFGGPGGGPGGGPASGPFGGPGRDFSGPGGGLSDDTAVLTPQRPAPEPGTQQTYDGPGGPRENVSGHTLTSGIPVVPPGAQSSPFGPGASAERATGPHTPPKLPDPAQSATATSSKPAKKKGRSKLVLLGGGLVVVAAGVYGAGLLMNHSDVPKGTTVLGVDIGGGTRDEAVKKLDEALGDRTDKALKLSVDGDTVSLKPDQAGLQLDADATVGAAAQSDYNPVSVIGSLFGQERVVEPVMPVDGEKLRAALERAAGGSGSATDGTIKFESGKAVAVYGKTGKGIAVTQSTKAVEEAYRTQVATGTTDPVKLPTTTQEPSVSKAEVDRMMSEFAKPAMSGIVTVKVDSGPQFIQFSPENSLWKFLGVKAQDGKLVEYYDRPALKELYGTTFDGVLITRGNGKKTAVTPEDVIGVLRKALLGKTEAERTGVIETNPS
ncbi:hypothetical protein ACFS5L_26600 [Streptomyces phyllanthi]|uniref:Peptidoglycan binding domain-containing protein n=1 Tax=Streptomyces phyllanthi TaxID=1803180 RepID=A0A5N8VYG9_9ACTN|nr:hypothetical protein [Streptomyces phyllanthi]MPY40297.1 hypothetical protein [Streptomyces phyllanthi]